MPKRGDPCTICGKPSVGRGWCTRHWQRWRNHGDPLYEPPSAFRRWLANVQFGTCWLWTASTDKDGYGKFSDGGFIRAHVWAYVFTYGPVPEGKVVCHTCDTPGCVRPSHLFASTHADNLADRNEKRRHAHGETHGMVKLTAKQVISIRSEHADGATHRGLAKKYEVGRSTIARALTTHWQHL